jgi:hypothetical protein
MSDPIQPSSTLKGLVWSEIPNGSYWVVPVSDNVFGASDHTELCRVFGDDKQRWIEYDGGVQDFNDLWAEFVFVPCMRPRIEDIDVSAGLAALKGDSHD